MTKPISQDKSKQILLAQLYAFVYSSAVEAVLLEAIDLGSTQADYDDEIVKKLLLKMQVIAEMQADNLTGAASN